MKFFGLFLLLFYSLSAFSEAGKNSSENKKLILIPIAYYTPETSAAGGFLLIKNFAQERAGKTSNLRLLSSLTLLGQSSVTLTPTFYFSGGDYELSGNFKYSYYPDLFFGRGLGGTLDEGEKFTQETSIAKVSGALRLVWQLFFRTDLNYEKYLLLQWDQGGRVDQEIQKIGSQYEVPSVAPSLEWDSRDYPQAPRQGAYYKLTASFYNAENLSNSAALSPFQKYELDLRQYIPVGQNNILALQFLNSEMTGAKIPFQYLNTIGGGSRLRGFYEGRYRDQALRVLQVENRYEFTDRWVGTVFAGAARLGSDESALDTEKSSKFFSTAGLGVNYIIDPENRTKLRADIGLGAKDLGFYFLIGEAY